MSSKLGFGSMVSTESEDLEAESLVPSSSDESSGICLGFLSGGAPEAEMYPLLWKWT